MQQAELNEIVAKHGKWLRAEEGGSRAVLTRADLTRAVLTDADLTDAVLTDAVLTRADLTGAVLTGADLTGADLTRADLTGAVLTGADLTGADLTGAVGVPEETKGLRKLIAETVLANPSGLEMATWHTCDTTHCIAGWACHLAPNGRWIESQLGTASAARFLLGLLGKGEDEVFYKGNAEALEVLKGWAQEMVQ